MYFSGNAGKKERTTILKYKKFTFDTNEINIYPLVCHHFGAKQSSKPFIDYVINAIKKDPLARWIYMGDAGECVIKNSKGNIYEQTLNPGDQLREAADTYSEVASKGLFGIRGNHGNRVDKEVGLGWDEMLCAKIGIPYLGVSSFVGLAFPRRSISLYTHHGSASAISAGGKMSAAHKVESIANPDIALTAHTHACGEAWPSNHKAYLDTHNKGIRWHTTRSFVCGSAYDSRSGYAEEKMYPPLTPEHIVIKVRLDSDGTLRVGHSKIVLDLQSGKVVTL